MSNREICNAMLDRLNEEQLAGIIAVIQNAIDEMEEAEDDAFCEKMLQNYLALPEEEKGGGITIEEFAKELGIDL